jgi:hypothetical protein
MGRAAHTKEQKRAKRRQVNQKIKSDPVKQAKKRETDRLRARERRRQASLICRNPLALLADAASRAQMLTEINIPDERQLSRPFKKIAPQRSEVEGRKFGGGGKRVEGRDGRENFKGNEGSMQLLTRLVYDGLLNLRPENKDQARSDRSGGDDGCCNWIGNRAQLMGFTKVLGATKMVGTSHI